MRLTNCTNEPIVCFADKIPHDIEPGGTIDLENFSVLMFSRNYSSFSTLESGTSRVLRLLSIIDDPFKLRREYHLVVEFEVIGKDLGDVQELFLQPKTLCADMELRTYYESFAVIGDGKNIRPSNVYISGCDRIQEDFKENDKHLARWTALWDVIIEPIFGEILGFAALYLVLLLCVGKMAWYIVFAFAGLAFLIELITFLCKSKVQRANIFNLYLEKDTIYQSCYNT